MGEIFVVFWHSPAKLQLSSPSLSKLQDFIASQLSIIPVKMAGFRGFIYCSTNVSFDGRWTRSIAHCNWSGSCLIRSDMYLKQSRSRSVRFCRRSSCGNLRWTADLSLFVALPEKVSVSFIWGVCIGENASKSVSSACPISSI